MNKEDVKVQKRERENELLMERKKIEEVKEYI